MHHPSAGVPSTIALPASLPENYTAGVQNVVAFRPLRESDLGAVRDLHAEWFPVRCVSVSVCVSVSMCMRVCVCVCVLV